MYGCLKRSKSGHLFSYKPEIAFIGVVGPGSNQTSIFYRTIDNVVNLAPCRNSFDFQMHSTGPNVKRRLCELKSVRPRINGARQCRPIPSQIDSHWIAVRRGCSPVSGPDATQRISDGLWTRPYQDDNSTKQQEDN